VKEEIRDKLYYKRASSYGMRFGNLKNLFGFNWFLLKNLIKRRKEYKIIHAADFDTIIPAVFMRIFFGKRVIYDIYDWYIDSRNLFKSFLRYPIQIIEYCNLKLSDMVIICEPEREKQIRFKTRNLQVLPNIPFFSEKIMPTTQPHENITIAYVGILGGSRGLENLITLAKRNPNIQVEVGGFGEMQDIFGKESKEIPNLIFYGRVAYKKALRIMGKADLIYAMYERTNPNHILAAPNKYYEGLYLGKPIITTVGTLVGEKTGKYNTGYCIDENVESLETLIKDIKLDDIEKKANNASFLWDNKYKNYVSDFMENKYLPFIIRYNE